MPHNLLQLPDPLPAAELFEAILTLPGLRIERIVSVGHTTPPGEWYDQLEDEWVLVLQGTGTLRFDDDTMITIAAGEHLFLPARKRHRVEQTSSQPPCIWLAIFATIAPPEGPSPPSAGA